ncbi:MAG: GFA family protein [Henriciella sp.]
MTKKIEGGCTCGEVRYEVLSSPLIVHCCHCRWCQRQTGTAFALNALFEAEHVRVTKGEVEILAVASPSGRGQTIARCQSCRIAVWSNYYMGGLKDYIRFIRVGTLDNPDLLPPDVHIFTSTKQPWVQLPDGAKAVEQFYNYDEVWSADNLARREALREDAGLA